MANNDVCYYKINNIIQYLYLPHSQTNVKSILFGIKKKPKKNNMHLYINDYIFMLPYSNEKLIKIIIK
jgi:hypothetical protein